MRKTAALLMMLAGMGFVAAGTWMLFGRPVGLVTLGILLLLASYALTVLGPSDWRQGDV